MQNTFSQSIFQTRSSVLKIQINCVRIRTTAVSYTHLDVYKRQTSILATRKGISLWTKEEADAVAAKAMSLTTEAEVEAYLKSVAKH